MALSVKGLPGTPTAKELNTDYWQKNGVFELSPERGRYALTYSIIENKSVYFTEGIARFAVPDIATYDSKYVSLFAPALSYIVAPGYFIGKLFGAAQAGTFAVVSVFALCNFLLIYGISRKLGANKFAAILGGMAFLFASPAFVYGVNLYQHHVSTFLILLSIYLLVTFKNPWVNIAVFAMCGLSVSVDYPNFFFMMPVGLVAFSRIFKVEKFTKKYNLSINLPQLLTPLIIILPLLFLFWFQAKSYGSPLRLAGSVATAKFDQDAKKKDVDLTTLSQEDLKIKKEKEDRSRDKNVVGFFESRNLLNAFYLHFISPDRGMITFTPIMLLGFIGVIFAYRNKMPYLELISSVLFIVIILYSLWTDPWGGWAFGSRYFVPVYAMLGIFISMLLTYYKRNLILMFIFLVLMFYSLGVNTAGALTTIANPPQVEVLALEAISGTVQYYSYDRAIDYLNHDESKAYVYNLSAKKYMNAWEYYSIVIFPLLVLSSGLVIALQFSKEERS